MKPRIYWDGHFKYWMCDGSSVVGAGRSPVEAYKQWKKDFTVMWLRQLVKES